MMKEQKEVHILHRINSEYYQKKNGRDCQVKLKIHMIIV
jgi:hypothetical protein